MNRSTVVRPFAVALLVAAALASGAASATAAEKILDLRAIAMNLSGVGRARAGTLDIVIERWTTDEEKAALQDVLIEKGGDRLLSALQKVKPRCGYVRTSTSLGWDIYYAREIPYGDGARRIILGSDRPMSFWELRNSTRSADYEFLVAEIHLNKDGKGEGKLAGGTKITYDKDKRTVELENYGIEPVRLTEVTVVEPKAKKK
jgi:hypothetical protein